MFLNTLKPARGSKGNPKRLGRGMGSGLGKTCGRGHKGQRARAGGFHKVGFEGGQMPLQRRLPKFGFVSPKALLTEKIRLGELNRIEGEIVTLDSLKAVGIIRSTTKFVKIFLAGELKKAVQVVGIPVSKGARSAIEVLGGKVE
jgi:large subunit ribosomal protein L15